VANERDGALEKTEPFGFGLQGGDCGGGFIAHRFQPILGGLSAESVDTVPERYKRFDFQIVLNVQSQWDDREFDFIICARDKGKEVGSADSTSSNIDDARTGLSGTINDQAMLCLPTNDVKCPKQIGIASLIWLEFPKERENARGIGFFVSTKKRRKVVCTVAKLASALVVEFRR
jgi:hypothetical protein